MRAFVTGGTGFIGSRVVALLREKGHEVRVLARDPAKAQRLLGLEPLHVIGGDLFSILQLREGVKSCDWVFHLAAEIATQPDAKKLWRVDVEGTESVADACEGVPLKAFVFASTVVVGDPRGGMLRPEDPLVATTAYGNAKQEAEARLARTRLPVVTVRPSHVYGPGGWFAELVNEFRAGRRFMPGSGANLWDVVHVDDVAQALVLAAEKGKRGDVLHAVDDYPVTMRDFFDRMAHEVGTGRPRSVPVFIAKLVKGSGPIAAAVRSARSDNSRLKGLGWKMKYPDSRDGIPAAVRELLRS